MREKILIISPPLLSPKPLPNMTGHMGVYALASYLRRTGKNIEVYDFLSEKRKFDGYTDERIEGIQECGNFENEQLSKRIYYIGSPEDNFRNFLHAYKPTKVFISCLFTFYWQGAKMVYDIVKELNPFVQLNIGGVYTQLCERHGREHFPDALIHSVITSQNKFENLDISLYRNIPKMFPVLTSIGCPFECKWCAVPVLEGKGMSYKNPLEVVSDIQEKIDYGVKSFRFLDSHLTGNYEKHFKIILKGLVEWCIKADFYSYGGINPIAVTQDMLELMARAGFRRIQLPIETVCENMLKKNNRPVLINQWVDAVKKLKRIKRFEIVSYLLCGIPGQTIQDIYKTINFLENNGVTPVPLFFSPIPKTLYEDNRDLEALHPFLFPCASDEMPAEELEKILCNYSSTGQQFASDIIKGTKTILRSGPAMEKGKR